MCIGRNMAMTNILKVVTTVVKCYQLDSTDLEDKVRTVSVGISEKEGPLRVRVQRRNLTVATDG
jgi:benzoate 4-monooxygenase